MGEERVGQQVEGQQEDLCDSHDVEYYDVAWARMKMEQDLR